VLHIKIQSLLSGLYLYLLYVYLPCSERVCARCKNGSADRLLFSVFGLFFPVLTWPILRAHTLSLAQALHTNILLQSISIIDPATSQNEFLGVTAIEMRTSKIEAIILSQQLFTTGYALLLQTDGTVVAGRVWDSATSNATVNLASFSDLFAKIQPLGVARASAQVVDGQSVFVSQSALIRNKYVIIHIVPQYEVLATVYAISAKVDSSFDQVLGVTAAVGVGTLIIVFFLSTFFATRITKPVVVVSEVALKIAANAVKDNVMEDIEFRNEFNSRDEVGELARAFKGMITSLSGKAPKSHSNDNMNEKSIEMKAMVDR
jgi:methyl-accepting chemotaxis protein